jgi:hypothetical protein
VERRIIARSSCQSPWETGRVDPTTPSHLLVLLTVHLTLPSVSCLLTMAHTRRDILIQGKRCTYILLHRRSVQGGTGRARVTIINPRNFEQQY